jgi:hypothetical protein
VTTGREQFGKQRERGNGISTSHHHGQDYIPPPANQEGRWDRRPKMSMVSLYFAYDNSAGCIRRSA